MAVETERAGAFGVFAAGGFTGFAVACEVGSGAGSTGTTCVP